MSKSKTSVAAPWWWPAVETDLAPRIAVLSTELGYSPQIAAQRVWAVLGLMIQPHFPTDALAVLFPEVALSDVERWKVRDAFVAALQDSREARLAHITLDCLAVVAREGALPSAPSRTGHHSKPPADWRQVFSPSSLGRNALFVRGTHRSHAGFNSYKTRYEHQLFRDVLEVGDRYGLVRTSFQTGSPANASSYEDYAAFLDGGLMSKAGGYFLGLHGAWVIGHVAVRFICFELGLIPPRVGAEAAPTHADLVRQILVQLATELPTLRQRLSEFQDR